MKSKLRLSTIFAAALALSPAVVTATDDFALGDLALVFYNLTGSAPGTFATEYYVFNLGPVSLYRENTLNDVPVSTVNTSIISSNIAADLESVFGNTWAEDGTVRMFAVTNITGSANPPTNGDPSRTFYFSSARASLNTNQPGFDPATFFPYYQGNPSSLTLSSGVRTPVGGAITSFLYTGVNGAIGNTTTPPTSGANVSGVRLTTGYPAALNGFIVPAVTTYFQLADNPSAVLGAGTLPGSAGVEAAVDIFRFVNSTGSGVDLTSGSSTGNAVVGSGQYIGAITLSTNGDLKVQGVGVAAPPAANYSTWATTNGVTGGTGGDSDFDGIINLVEYALNLNPAGSDGSAGTFTSGTVSFTKRAEAIMNSDVSWVIETSTSLAAGSWSPAVTQLAGDSATAISYTFPPPGPTKNFARLRVQQVTP